MDPSLQELPDSAWELYRHVYKDARDVYERDHEEASRSAWRAVERFYERTDKGWVHR